MIAQGSAADSQTPGGPRLIILLLREGVADTVPRRRYGTHAIRGAPFVQNAGMRPVGIGRFLYKNVGKRCSMRAEQAITAKHIFKLAHVPRPGEIAEKRGIVRGKGRIRKFRPEFPEKRREFRNGALAEWREADGEYVQPEKQILPETPGAHGFIEIPVRGAYEPEIHGNAAFAPHGSH